jgi:hypothetical protein
MFRFIFVLIGGALFYGAWWWHRRNERIKASWQVMTADVVQMIRVERKKGPDRWQAVYRYHVNGREFFGQCDGSANTTISASSDCAPGSLRGASLPISSSGKLEVGRFLQIHVNPADPSQSHASGALSLVGPIGLSVAGVIFIALAMFAPDHGR